MLAAGAIGVQAAITLPLAEADPSVALAASIAFFGSFLLSALNLLVGDRRDESWESRDRRLLWACAFSSGAGIVICLAGLSLAIEDWELFVVGFLALGSVGSLAAAARRRLEAPKKGRLAAWLTRLGEKWPYEPDQV